MNKLNRERLINAKLNYEKRKYPNVPYLVDKIKWRETSANGLTNIIVHFLRWSGHQAERVNTTGIYDVRTKKFRRTTATRGSADIHAIINAKPVKIEIKIGKDRQSDYQKEYERSVIEAGGHYWIIKDFDMFIALYDTL